MKKTTKTCQDKWINITCPLTNTTNSLYFIFKLLLKYKLKRKKKRKPTFSAFV